VILVGEMILKKLLPNTLEYKNITSKLVSK